MINKNYTKIIIFTIIIFNFIILGNLVAQTDDRWIYLGTNDEFSFYYDSETAIYDGRVITAHVKYSYFNHVKINYSILKYKFYCGFYAMKLVSYATYNKDGTIISNRANENNEDIIPDSIGEFIYNYLCDLLPN